MAAATQEHGTVASNTAGAPIPGLMAPLTKENGNRGTCMGTALSKPPMVLDILEAGSTTKKMALVPRYMLMVMFTKVYGVLEKQMDQDDTFGRSNKQLVIAVIVVAEQEQLETSMTENGGKVKCMDKAPLNGSLVNVMTVSGGKVYKRVSVCLHGRMGRRMKGSGLVERSMGLECSVLLLLH